MISDTRLDYSRYGIMLEKEVRIINKLGLHVRAATKLVQLASEFDVDITIGCNEQEADAKSIMEVLMLAAIFDSTVVIKITGESPEEERKALDSLEELINNRFDEIE